RGFAGGRQFLALEIGILRRTKPQVTGVRLRCQHLASRRLEVLLRERFAHLLPEDESGDQDEGPKHHHDPGGVATKESKSTCQHRCHRILRASCTWGNTSIWRCGEVTMRSGGGGAPLTRGASPNAKRPRLWTASPC